MELNYSCYLFKRMLFIYFYREGKGGRKTGRETSIYNRNINLLPPAGPQPGTWPTPRHVP